MTGRATPRRLRFRANGAASSPDGTSSKHSNSYEERGCRSRNRCYPEQGPGARTRGWQWWIAGSSHAMQAREKRLHALLWSALDESSSLILDLLCLRPATRLRSARAGIEALGGGVCEPDMTCHCRGYQRGAMANCRWAARKFEGIAFYQRCVDDENGLISCRGAMPGPCDREKGLPPGHSGHRGHRGAGRSRRALGAL